MTQPDGEASHRAPGDDDTYAAARARMIETQLRARARPPFLGVTVTW